MAYDSARYQVKHTLPNIRATFAGALKGTTASNTNQQTSADAIDRLEFFQAIKLTGFKVLPEVPPDATTHATSMTVYGELCMGTVTLARASIGTVAGVMANGTIVVSSLASGTGLNIRASVTGWDGTVQTVAPGCFRAYIEYQEKV
ncbi:MAG: hypothetical protein D4S01_07875 [Dehalococcoidia bacterium]|nr:MAG: hypothetical protein D4S01_07875 [Dehalococcoidia bacterium]